MKKVQLASIIVVTLIVITVAFIFISHSRTKHKKVDWSYTGTTAPETWWQLADNYSLCKTSKTQSPIDITKTKSKKHDKDIKFHYSKIPFDLDLNQHNLFINFGDNMRKDYVSVNGKKYYLMQIHFHVPSEHLIDGKQHLLEAHLVHNDLEGDYLAVAVFFDVGEANPYLTDLFGKSFFNSDDTTKYEEDISLDPSDLLPEAHDYYAYLGSLTTPPCTEPVQWILLKQPMSVTLQQLDFFKSKVIAYNARPVQALNDRTVLSVRG